MTGTVPPPQGDGALVLTEVEIRTRGVPLFDPVSVTIPSGGVVTVMGPSGSGKSTLLAWMTGTLDPAFTGSGRVVIDGEDVTRQPPERRRLGILFQDDMLFPHLSVAENLAFALPATVRSRAERRDRVTAALTDVGLDGFADRDPATLSGGQRSRVALLRTLLAEPRALLLDEPFSRLDGPLRDRFRHLVFEHARDRRLPTLLVTHDPEDAAAGGGPTLHLQSRSLSLQDDDSRRPSAP